MKNAKKRGTPFTKDRQPPAAAKRVKKKKTLLKEKLGLQSWEALGEYVTQNGVPKLLSELKKLTPNNYVKAHLQAAEYFKPKLTRTEHAGSVTVSQPVDLSKLTTAELKLWMALNNKATQSDAAAS